MKTTIKDTKNQYNDKELAELIEEAVRQAIRDKYDSPLNDSILFKRHE